MSLLELRDRSKSYGSSATEVQALELDGMSAGKARRAGLAALPLLLLAPPSPSDPVS